MLTVAEAALNGMRYYSAAAVLEDTVTVTVYDGAGGGPGALCLAEKYFRSASVRRTCNIAACSVAVSVRTRVQ